MSMTGNNPKLVLQELYVGIIIYGAIFMLLGFILIKPFWIFAIALIVGLVGACLLAYSIYDTLDRALDMHAEGARKKVTLHSFLRLGGSAGAMIIAIMIHWSAFVGVTVRLLGLKSSPFFNSLIRRYIFKRS